MKISIYKKLMDPRIDRDQVLVIILSPDEEDKRVRKLREVFDSPLFLVKILNIPASTGIACTSKMTHKQSIESHRIVEALEYSYAKYPNNPVIIIKDSSVTYASSDIVETIITNLLEEKGWDVTYLSKWLDRCDLYQQRKRFDGSLGSYTRTLSPNGSQAFLFTTDGRDIIIGRKKMPNGNYFTPICKPFSTQLNEAIANKQIIALALTPNLFQFDIFEAESVTDLAKVSNCRRPDGDINGNGDENGQPGILPFVWFLVIVIGIIVLGWAFYHFFPRYS